MKAALHIGCRAALYSTLVLVALLVPLAHSAHFHEGDGHGDASISATCVACQVAGFSVAEVVQPVDLPHEVSVETCPAPLAASSRHSILLFTEASRAPPASLAATS